jgi:hypothetical protein
MMPFAALSLVALANPSQCTQEQVDSFCQLYTKVIVNKGDGTIVAPLGMKKRLLANELKYRELCPQPSL